MRKRRSRQEPTDEDLERGREFAAWFKAAMTTAGTNPSSLAKATGLSSGHLYDLARDGIKVVDGIPGYKRPSEEMVRLLAQTLRADLSSGLKAAGYDADPQPPVAAGLASLPLSLQHRLAGLISDIVGTTQVHTTVTRVGSGPMILEEPGSYLGRTRPDSGHSKTADSPTSYTPGVYGLSSEDLVTLPILGFVGAVGESFDIHAIEHREGERTVPRSMLKHRDPERCFFVKVRGRCLEGSHILDGDIAVCVSAESADDGQVVVVIDDDYAVLKRFRQDGASCWLETDEADGSRNTYPIQGAPRIIGLMIGLNREF